MSANIEGVILFLLKVSVGYLLNSHKWPNEFVYPPLSELWVRLL